MNKIDFPIDKHAWHPSLIPGPIVLISTYNAQGEPNIAPKSLVQMVSINPPIMMFSGTQNNTTEKNILKTQCFGVNFVHSSIASKVYDCVQWFGQERIQKTGFTLINASKISAPLVSECRAHLECILLDSKEVGRGFVIFGEIVKASIWDHITKVDFAKRYELFDQIIYLESGFFCQISNLSKIEFSKEEYLANKNRTQSAIKE